MFVHVLGAGNGRPGPERDTSGLLLEVAGRYTLVDCPGGIVAKLARIGLAPEAVQRIILTHDHVDHIYGVPHLIHALAIGGSVVSVPIYGPAATLATVDAVLSAYQLIRPGYPEIDARPVPVEPGVTVLADEIRVVASPARHSRPTLALRIESDNAVLGLSSDGLPSDETARLCADADLLLHDCGGVEADRARFGDHHASAADAGGIARRAGARSLLLTHLPPVDAVLEARMIAEAKARFDGPVELARDGDRHEIKRVG